VGNGRQQLQHICKLLGRQVHQVGGVVGVMDKVCSNYSTSARCSGIQSHDVALRASLVVVGHKYGVKALVHKGRVRPAHLLAVSALSN
jgi:hypothetical protein